MNIFPLIEHNFSNCPHWFSNVFVLKLELQASYDEVVQELRGLEVEREALLFQVDVLQDTLEGIEELLAEAHREAGQANSVCLAFN